MLEVSLNDVVKDSWNVYALLVIHSEVLGQGLELVAHLLLLLLILFTLKKDDHVLL